MAGASHTKTPKSAVVIVPDNQSPLWMQIQAIREKHDKAFVRWMPHINLLYPFLVDDVDSGNFEDAAKKLTECLRDFKPFTVSFSKASFGHFTHSKSCTLWLKALQTSTACEPHSSEQLANADASVFPHHPAVLELQRRIQSVFPDCDDLSKISEAGFQPHLSLGQFKPGKISEFTAKFQEQWLNQEFTVKEIYLISRKDFHDPFHIRYTVTFGGDY